MMITMGEKAYSKLNLGCGRDTAKKLPMPWLNVDVDGPAADVLCDLRQLPQAWTEAVDEVRASHVLEHLFLEDMPLVLAEWQRVLVPGGVVRVIVPDMKIVVEALVNSVDSKGRKSVSVTDTTAVLTQIYGIGYETSKTQDAWRHRFLFNEDLLKELLVRCGFQNAERYSQDDDPAKNHGVKDDSQNRFSLCVTAQKPKEGNR